MTPSLPRNTQGFARLAATAALLTGLGFSPRVHPQAATEHFLPLPSADLQRLAPRLDPTLISPTARKLHLEPKQSFYLVPHGDARIDLVSVDYEQPQGSHGVISSLGCGFFLVPSSGSIQFFGPLIGADDLPIGCWDVTAVRLHRVPGGKPFFEFTGDLRTSQRAWQQPFTVRWNPQSARYTMDTVDFK